MKNRPTGHVFHSLAKRRNTRRPRFDNLEPRQLMAMFVVQNTNDLGAGSLRLAITQLDASTDPSNTIDFQITGGGQHQIVPATALPAITEPVLIDGYSQPTARANSLPQGTDATIFIQILGSNLGSNGVGFSVQAQNVTIQGLALDEFYGAAISESTGAGNDTYDGNYIGADPSGTSVVGNGNGVGVLLTGPGSTVGGATPGARNLISGNSLGAVVATGTGVTGALVSDNLIGTDAGGLNFLRNPGGVVFSAGVTNSTIGGITVLAQNVISSNGSGVLLSGAGTTGNLVAGNYLGPNITGAVSLGNTTGVEVTAPGNTIGGLSSNFRNLIAGNTAYGVLLDSSVADPLGSVVDGNYIGVNPIGSATEGNAIGIGINGADHVTIGGTGSAGNLISGNTITGVQIFGVGASNNVVQGNLIGTDATGALSVPNNQFGIEISNGTGNVVGGSGSTFRNVISGNTQVGLQIDGGSADQVLNNFIGTDSTGEVALGNSLAGVVIRTSGNSIGSNLISANSGSGIAIGAVGISGNSITGNTIGLDSTGENALGNAAAGINITAGTNTTIGGSSAALRNVISANALAGISISGGAISQNSQISGNFIGLDRAGSVAFGNGTKSSAGVVINGTPSTSIGGIISPLGAAISLGNVISGQAGYGILISGAGDTGVVVQANLIGTNSSGTAALGNSLGGISLDGTGDSIGGSVLGAGNVISGNGGDGIDLIAVTTTGSGNLVAGNFVGVGTGGTTAIANSGSGLIDNNAPNITIGGTSGGALNIFSANKGAGISISGAAASGVFILGNDIGPIIGNATSVAGNSLSGVIDSSPSLTLGLTTAGSTNVISGNGGAGVSLGAAATGSALFSNIIGLNGQGLVKLPNAGDGVDVLAKNVSIGSGTGFSNFQNLISGNAGAGIFLALGADNALIAGNFIGSDTTGTVAEGNGTSGILSNGAKSTTIGGLVLGAANEISGNTVDGIRFTGSGSIGAVVEFNSIGTNANASATAVGNGVYGISVEGPSNVSIGGTAGNAIDYNGTTGNANSKPGATGGVGIKLGTNIPILNNSFVKDTGLGIDLGEDGVTANTTGSPHTGPNDFQNFPVLTKALVSATSTEVLGSLNSTPNTQFTIQFFSSPTANASGFGEGAKYLASVLVTTDATGNVSFDEILSNVVAAGQIITATATDPQGNTSEFSADITAANAATALTIVLSATPNPVEDGSTLTYKIVVTNFGPNPATGVTVNDLIPSTAPYVIGSATTTLGTVSVTSGTLTALIGSLGVNQSATITFQVTPNTPSPPLLSDTATVTSNEGNTTPANGSSTVDVTVSSNAILAVTLTQAFSPVRTPSIPFPLIGQDITYVATVTNDGPDGATNVVLDDILPNLGDVTLVSVTPSAGGVADPNALPGHVRYDFPSVANGFAAQLSIVVKVNSDPALVGAGLTDSVSATSDISSTVSASVSAIAAAAADLAVSISGSAASASDGTPFTYTVTGVNNGPSAANGVTITDTLPGNSTFVSASLFVNGTTVAVSAPVGGILVTPSFSLASGANAVLTLIVSPTSTNPLTDQASVPILTGSATDPTVPTDPIVGNNTSTLTTDVNASADVTIVVTGSPSSVAVGSTLNYTITATNHGPDQANGVVATDTVAQFLSLQSVQQSQGTFVINGQVVTLDFGTIPAGQTATAMIPVVPTASVVTVGNLSATVVNTATVTSATNPTVVNSGSTQNTVTASADVGIALLSGNPNPALVGQNLVYTFVVENFGPSEATDVQAVDTLPLNLALVGSNPITTTQGGFFPSATGVTFDFGDLPSGETATATITVVPSPLAATNVTNLVTVTSFEADPVSTNNQMSVTTRVNPAADLVVTGVSLPPVVLIGQNITYAITVENEGPSPADSVTLTDTIPDGSSFVSVTVPPGDSPGQELNVVTVSLGTLAIGQSATVDITVLATATGTITNTATATAVESNPSATDGTALTTTTVNPSSDVNVTLVGLPNTVLLGNNLTYTANVLNNGPSTATGIVLTDNLPAGLKIVSASSTVGTVNAPIGTVTGPNGVVTVDIGDLASGGIATLNLVVTPVATGTYTNTAVETSTQNDPTASNNSASTTSQVVPAANISVTATSSANPAPLNQNLIFTLTITNPGPSDATNVLLTDTLPAGVSFVSASSSSSPGSSYFPVGSVLSIPIGTLPVGQSATVTIVVNPQRSGTLNNTASVSADQANTTPAASNVDLTIVAGVPGALQFAAPTYEASQTDGVATIYVDRLGGSDGPVSINYSTSNGTGQSNLDYTPVSGSLFFASGQTVASFTVPILDNTSATSNRTVNLILTSPAGGATLGTLATSVLTILPTASSGGGTVPVDTTAPEVTNLHRIGFHHQTTQLILTFSEPLNPTEAQNLANYQVLTSTGGGPIPILSATYNATASTVTLVMFTRLNVHKTYFLTVFSAVTSAGGTPLASNYVAPVDFATLGLGKATIAGKTESHHPVKTVKAKSVAHWATHVTARKFHTK